MLQPVLIAGQWRASHASGQFQAENPATGEPLPEVYPISTWADCDAALESAAQAWRTMRELPGERLATYLEAFAARIEASAAVLVERAHLETAYPKSPRLADVELPRTVNQLRQSAASARDGSWALATIDSKINLRSQLAAVGPVVVFGPNNFPFAYGGASGGDFASAIAVGCPVIAKGNPSHPGTIRLFAELARQAAEETGMPAGTLQLIYRTSHTDGERLVSDPRVGATGYTGGRGAGLKLKAAADAAGKPIYLELSSTNPVVILPGALTERREPIVEQYCASALMGCGQFCTNPGLVLLVKSAESEAWIAEVVARYRAAPVGVLLSRLVVEGLQQNVGVLRSAGAELLCGGERLAGPGYRFANTALRASGKQFLAKPELLQTEMFGNASLFVVVDDLAQLLAILDHLEGNLTGSIYSCTQGSDEESYRQVAARLRVRVGRMLNDKMPTGVAVSAAMNHGGPYPSTGHPGFTAVGVPAALRRFTALDCYDMVRESRLPPLLRDKNPTGKIWRFIDGTWSTADVE